jgi:ectoine hydroxylase-related dioxygenase (phytanoyl-CoA dioxygenase family)
MTQDLAQFHRPISDFVPRPATAAEWKRYALSAAQVDFFHDHGYLPGIRLFDDAQVAQLRTELADLMQPGHPGNELFHEYHSNESRTPGTVLFHALGAWRIKPGFHDLLWHPAITVAASQLLGDGVRFWHDQLFCKPANHGGVVAWHQDYSYWTRTKPMGHLTVWYALDDSLLDNGCVHYVPGSHRWPLLPVTGLAGDMRAIESVLTPEQKAQFDLRVPVELKAGYATFHHPLMVHGSYENRTTRPRRAGVVNVFRDGTRSAADQPLLNGVPVIPRNEAMEGTFFPLLIGEVGGPLG